MAISAKPAGGLWNTGGTWVGEVVPIATDDVITCGAGNETFTIDLPEPVEGKVYFIKNVGTGVITVDADTTGSTTIDGETTQTVDEYECLQIVSDATEYWIV